MNNYIIIPARMGSERLPGKPLLDKTGKYLIQHTWEKCKKVKGIKDVVIATQEEEIAKACESFGATVMYTYECSIAGTERSIVAASKLIDPNYILSVQCEYPEINSLNLQFLLDKGLENPKSISTLAYFTQDRELYLNKNRVKVLFDNFRQAIYFSRLPIPYPYGLDKFLGGYIHVGVYGFDFQAMFNFYKVLWDGNIEITIAHFEKLEQLRWLYLDFQMFVYSCTYEKSIDTLEDYVQFVREYSLKKPSPSV